MCHVALWMRSPHLSHNPAKFGVCRPSESGSHDHVIDVSRDFVGEIPSYYVTTLLSLESTGLVKVEI